MRGSWGSGVVGAGVGTGCIPSLRVGVVALLAGLLSLSSIRPASAQYVGRLGGEDVFYDRAARTLYRVDDARRRRHDLRLPDDVADLVDAARLPEGEGAVRLVMLRGGARSEKTFAVLTPTRRHVLPDAVTGGWGLLVARHARSALALTPDGARVVFSEADSTGTLRPVTYDYRTGARQWLPLDGVFTGFCGRRMYLQRRGPSGTRTLFVTEPPYGARPVRRVMTLGRRAQARPMDGGALVARPAPGARQRATRLRHVASGAVVQVEAPIHAVFYDDARDALGVLDARADETTAPPMVRYVPWTALVARAARSPASDAPPTLARAALAALGDPVPLYDPAP